MRKISVLFFVFLNALIGEQIFAQLVISAEKMNIVYAGIENPISIAVAGVPANQVQIKIVGGTIKDADSVKTTRYMVVPDWKSRTLQLTAYSLKNNDTAFYGTYHFRVKQIPMPEISISGKKCGSQLSKGMLRAAPFVTLQNAEDFPFNIPAQYSIIEFTISFSKLTESGDSIVVENTVVGNKIPDNILNQIMQLPSNSKIYIENIKARHVTNSIQNIGSCTIEIL